MTLLHELRVAQPLAIRAESGFVLAKKRGTRKRPYHAGVKSEPTVEIKAPARRWICSSTGVALTNLRCLENLE